MVIVEVSRGLAHVYGEQNSVHVSEVDYIIEGDQEPAAELPNPTRLASAAYQHERSPVIRPIISVPARPDFISHLDLRFAQSFIFVLA